jgi:hypothetical protein
LHPTSSLFLIHQDNQCLCDTTRRSNRVSGTKEKGALEECISNVAELDTTTTETEDNDSKTEEEEKELEEFGYDNGKEGVQESSENCEPIDMEIDIGSDKDSSLSTLGLPGGTTTKKARLGVIQNSRLSNWAKHHFLCANKIMSFDEAAKDKAAQGDMQGDWN